MKLQTDLLFRVPQFSFNEQLSEKWEELKQSISRSSDSFYQLIKDLEFEELDKQSESIRHTIWKYFNRACFRATPFGSFGSIGIADIGSSIPDGLMISGEQQLHCYPNWPETEKVQFSFAELVERNVMLIANSTYYCIGDDIRYVGHFQEGYLLVDIEKTGSVIAILEASKRPIRISAVLSVVNDNIDQCAWLNQIERMLDEQLLFCELHPNIIGTDYFDRIEYKPEKIPGQYIIAERSLITGTIDRAKFKNLPDLLVKLHQTLPSYGSPELEQFKNRFLKKFGEQSVPLMVALDPEIGIGYGNMDHDSSATELIEQLQANKNTIPEEPANSTLNLLLPKLIGQYPQTLSIEDIKPPDLPGNLPLPNTLSVLCTVVDDLIIIEHMGGTTANALLGRFTHINEKIWNMTKNMAAIEAEANPGVSFFDVGYLVGNHVDNINRRKSVYDLQLNLLNYDTTPSPLYLNDIEVSIQGNEVVLWSTDRQIRMVPKLATAYNYLLSDLPVFRFFCDLQNQGIHKNLYLRLRDRIPNLEYYPRVQFRNLILSPAAWRLNWKDFNKVRVTECFNFITEHLSGRHVPQYFRVGNGDQTLLFNSKNETDIEALVMLLKKELHLYAEEAFLPETPLLKDELGNPYLSQILLNLSHDKRIYPGLAKRPFENSPNDIILPGREWLYFEIYCHPLRTDHLLTNIIGPFIEAYRKVIRKWFFIRYNENGDHIRLRLKLKNPEEGQQLTAGFSTQLKEMINAGTVSDVVIKCYRRETERYGTAHIDQVESHFCSDSHVVLQLLAIEECSNDQKYLLCLELIHAVESAGIFGQNEFRKILEDNSNGFNREHRVLPAQFRLLNMEFKKLRTGNGTLLSAEQQDAHSAFAISFIELLRLYKPEERPGIFSSLLHMHINRLFTTAQRVHETVIYYLRVKTQESELQQVKIRSYPN